MTSECPNDPNSSSSPTAGGPKLGGMFADLKPNSTLGAGLYTSLRVNKAPTAEATCRNATSISQTRSG